MKARYLLRLRADESMLRARTHQMGYTLIEMMVTVLIIGILAALAGPMVGGTSRERRKTQAAHDVVRIFHRTRSRALESGRAHLVRFSASANSNKGALYVVRGNTNLCRTSTFSAPVAANCPSGSSAGDVSLICTDWWEPATYESLGSSYTVQLMNTTGRTNATTASSLVDPDFCFDGRGIMYWRLGGSGSFSDVPVLPGASGTVLSGAGFSFSVRTVQGGTDRGVVRRILVPFGAEARSVR